jgi:hypothetical protein
LKMEVNHLKFVHGSLVIRGPWVWKTLENQGKYNVAISTWISFSRLTHSTHGAEPFLRSRQLCSYSRISQHFMEPEGSLPCSQEPSTGSYPKPDQSNPYHPILYL